MNRRRTTNWLGGQRPRRDKAKLFTTISVPNNAFSPLMTAQMASVLTQWWRRMYTRTARLRPFVNMRRRPSAKYSHAFHCLYVQCGFPNASQAGSTEARVMVKEIDVFLTVDLRTLSESINYHNQKGYYNTT